MLHRLRWYVIYSTTYLNSLYTLINIFCLVTDQFIISSNHDVTISYSFKKMSTVLPNTAVIPTHAKSLPIKGVGLSLDTVGEIQMVQCCRWSAGVGSTTGESLNCVLENVDPTGTMADLTFNPPITKTSGVIQFALGPGVDQTTSGQLCPIN